MNLYFLLVCIRDCFILLNNFKHALYTNQQKKTERV